MLKKLFWMLRRPDAFFLHVSDEGPRQAFIFFLQVSGIIAIFTPITNYLGWPSSDLSASFQAQIMAWQITEDHLLPVLGGWGYVVEAFLILVLSVTVALLVTGFLHITYRLFGGKGPMLNAWKATCYGAGPCILFGWIPYWSLMVATWSLLLQFYYAPKMLYRMREGTALAILAFIVGATLLELMTKGTTVGF